MQRAPGGIQGGAQAGGGALRVGGFGDGVGDGHAVRAGPQAVGDIGGRLDAAEGDYRDLHGVLDFAEQGQTFAGCVGVQ